MKKILLITVIVAALGGVSYLAYQQWFSNPAVEDRGEVDEPDRTINYNPPTQDELEETDDFKENQTDDDTDTNTDTEAGIALNNFGQNDSGSVYANATVNGDSDGKCTFIFSSESGEFKVSAEIEMAPTGYYACGVNIDSDRFSPKGEWTVQAVLDNNDEIASEVRTAVIK